MAVFLWEGFLMVKPLSNKIPTVADSYATRFCHAVTRRPSNSAVDGLRARNTGMVDIHLMTKQHRDYREALGSAGAQVNELPALPEFPDAQFVEDTALCLPGLAVMMRPWAKTRRGEVPPMRAALSKFFDEIVDVVDGFIEAGDILVTPFEVLVGLSTRTDQTGVDQLQSILNDRGYAMRVWKTPPDVLHFKTDCSLIDDNCILTTERLLISGCFDGYQTLLVPSGEELAANMVRYNDYIIMPEGFPKTEALLKAEGFKVLTVGNSECAKIDGGMSCLSLRF